jgi:Ni/Co efflux regulator RcnB
MRRISTLLLLLAVMGFAVPRAHSQTAAQERKEHPQKAHPDIQANMLRARQALQTAKQELVNSGGEWGGHRMGAIEHVDQALQEVQKAEAWAKEHKDIK